MDEQATIRRAARDTLLSRAASNVADVVTTSQWRPIETAPRDGTAILVAFRDNDAGRWQAVVEWDMSDDRIGFRWCTPVMAEGYNEHMATHWMPLPEPPPSSV